MQSRPDVLWVSSYTNAKESAVPLVFVLPPTPTVASSMELSVKGRRKGVAFAPPPLSSLNKRTTTPFKRPPLTPFAPSESYKDEDDNEDNESISSSDWEPLLSNSKPKSSKQLHTVRVVDVNEPEDDDVCCGLGFPNLSSLRSSLADKLARLGWRTKRRAVYLRQD